MNALRAIGIAAICVGLTACWDKVPAGNVGIMVNLLGSDKGVQAQELGVGRYWVGFNQELYLFPTFTQTYAWAKGDKVDESITFNDKDGQVVGTDVGITYHINPDKASILFQKYRKNLEEITDINLRNMVRDGFAERASKMSIEEIYGVKKADLVNEVQADVQAEVKDFGIVIEKVYLINHMRLPPAIENAINAKANAVQLAEQKQNEIVGAQAEAQKEIAAAQGVAQSKLIVAEAEAKAIKLKSDALNNSPALVQWQAVDKWDGHLPTVNGGAMPFINVGPK
jgi:regulator of protease activity HflC (stomatin/prohibitin superfamily)